MTASVDYLIVGSGITGATIARSLKDAGREVLVVDKRFHVGGNVHDFLHPSGIRVHTYGPHYFRTSSDEIWKFVNRFSEFYSFEASLRSLVDGKYEHWPVVRSYINSLLGSSWKVGFTGEPKNFEEASLAMMPPIIYESFIKGYTEKQWGVPPSTLDANLAGRFEISHDNDKRLKRHRYQGLPVDGYEEMMLSMLEGIDVELNFDYLKKRDKITARKLLVFTGPIDEYFGCSLGKLRYRAQTRQHEYRPGVKYVLPAVQVNNPSLNNGPHIRQIEWKHMLPERVAREISGSVITTETPFTPTDSESYEYPFPDQENKALYNRYRKLCEGESNIVICGRLGEYRYLDMDQAIGRALVLSKRILKEEENCPTEIEEIQQF